MLLFKVEQTEAQWHGLYERLIHCNLHKLRNINISVGKIEVQWSGRKLRYRWNLSSKLGKADGFPDMILILASQIVNFPP